MAEDFVLALGGLVFGGVEEGAGVGGPGEGAGALGGVGEVGPGAKGWIITADVEGVLAEAGGVGGVGEEVAVGADREGAEGHEGVAFGELVDVEDDLFGLGGVEGGVEIWIGGGASAVDGVLAALEGACGVEPGAEAVGDGLVGLLDVGEHLGVELRLEVGGGSHDGSGVGVLGLEVGEDFWGFFVAHPAEVVLEGDAVQRGGCRFAAGYGRLNGCGGREDLRHYEGKAPDGVEVQLRGTLLLLSV